MSLKYLSICSLPWLNAVDVNDNNIKQNPRYYKRSRAIVEHTLLKGLQKVNGEMNLIMFCYNFLRTKNILGFEKMLQAINNWQPDREGYRSYMQ